MTTPTPQETALALAVLRRYAATLPTRPDCQKLRRAADVLADLDDFLTTDNPVGLFARPVGSERTN